MRTCPLCYCKLPYSSAEQICMKTAFVWRMRCSQKAYSHLQNARKLLQLSRALLESQIFGGFSASELEALCFQKSNCDWSYDCLNIHGFDYSWRMSSLYMFESTWFVASFPGSHSKFLLHSFSHTVPAMAVNIFSIHRAQGGKLKPSVLCFLIVVVISRKSFYFMKISSPRSNMW